MSKQSKQLNLDYFAEKLVDIKNEIKHGKVNPIQPLADYITAFQGLPEDRIAKLPEFVSLFSTLCDILDYKVQAFTAMVFDFNKDVLTRFYQDPAGIDAILPIVPWLNTVELSTMSDSFLQEIMDNLGKERRVIPACEVVDDDKNIHVDFVFPVEQQNFLQEKASILETLQQHDKLGQGKNVPLVKILDYLEHNNDIDRMKAFIHVLHLIQDGDLIMNEDKDDATNAKLRLWRRPA